MVSRNRQPETNGGGRLIMQIKRRINRYFHIIFTPFTYISNQDTYESEDIVQFYARDTSLQKAEETILNELRDRLPTMKMLDIGIGAGRTTHHFAPLVKEYVGVDYASKMVEKCREIFSEHSPAITLKVADARDLSEFKEGYFDFVLFEYNGIDCMDYDDRLKSMREIKRVTRKGGFFCFSSNNLNSVSRALKFRYSRNIIILAHEIYKYLLRRLLNRDLLRGLEERQFVYLRDGGHDFRMKAFLSRPQEQVRQLTELGFKNIKIYSFFDGKEIAYSTLDSREDPHLYYLCNVD
jgi:ubiquinone/menaquinone biosynthesis C-methylase UbiE